MFRSYKILANVLLMTTSLITPNMVSSADFMSQQQAQDRLTLKDTTGKEFYLYKVSGLGKKCGYRVFNITPKDMVDKLLNSLDSVVTYSEDGEKKNKTVKEIIIDDMANNGMDLGGKANEITIARFSDKEVNVTSNDIKEYLEDVYINGKIDYGELSNLLIPAVAHILEDNVDFYTFDRGTLKLKYHIEVKNPINHIKFYNNGTHFERLLPVIGATDEEKKSAEFSDKVYWYINEHQYDITDLNQLIPDSLPADIRSTAPSTKEKNGPKQALNKGLPEHVLRTVITDLRENTPINEIKGKLHDMGVDPTFPVNFDRIMFDIKDKDIQGLVHLFPNIQTFSCQIDYVTDEGMKALSSLKNLQSLQLFSCGKITNEGIKSIAKITPLQELILVGISKVNDDGFKSICETLTGLKKLELSGALISNEGLLSLGLLKNLKELKLNYLIFVTKSGISELQKLLPNLVIQTESGFSDELTARQKEKLRQQQSK